MKRAGGRAPAGASNRRPVVSAARLIYYRSGFIVMGEAPRRGPAVEPREIMQESDALLRVTWGDGRECHYGAPLLRRLCPCAQCVNEFTGERVLRPETVAEDLTMEDVGLVGRYALTFRWSDGHDTGIYSFRYLREICEGD